MTITHEAPSSPPASDDAEALFPEARRRRRRRRITIGMIVLVVAAAISIGTAAVIHDHQRSGAGNPPIHSARAMVEDFGPSPRRLAARPIFVVRIPRRFASR